MAAMYLIINYEFLLKEESELSVLNVVGVSRKLVGRQRFLSSGAVSLLV